jgi:S1-C subfamily serine protease
MSVGNGRVSRSGVGGSPNTSLPAFSVAHAGENAGRTAGFADIVEKVKPAVISVRVRVEGGPKMMDLDDENGSGDALGSAEDFFCRFGIPEGMIPDRTQGERSTIAQGSGFFISADGYAVTNAHVVHTAESAEIMTQDGKIYSARVIGTDPKTDLALIKVDQRTDFPFVKLADSVPRVGDRVFALGNPFGLEGTVTAGIVSARDRDMGTRSTPYSALGRGETLSLTRPLPNMSMSGFSPVIVAQRSTSATRVVTETWIDVVSRDRGPSRKSAIFSQLHQELPQLFSRAAELSRLW